MKAKKISLNLLHNLLIRSPDIKGKDESVKLSNFFRAVKKPLRDILDERAELNKAVNEKIAPEQKAFAELWEKIEPLQKVEKLSEASALELAKLKEQVRINQNKADVKTKKETEALTKLNERLDKEEGEAVFDNEDFLYMESLFKGNPQVFFGGKTSDGKDALSLSDMDIVFELFETAK